MYTLHREIEINTTPEKAWDFVSNPANLSLITPEKMDFQIVSPLPDIMFNGMMAEYRVRIPVIGRTRWVSEIKHIEQFESFVDEQRIGPYKLWLHYHKIEPRNAGIRLIDHVMYEVPFGGVGRLAHRWFIQKTLAQIFDFREAVLPRILA